MRTVKVILHIQNYRLIFSHRNLGQNLMNFIEVEEKQYIFLQKMAKMNFIYFKIKF